MAITMSDPRYGLSMTFRTSSGDNTTKSFNYINLAIPNSESASGYTANDCFQLINAIAKMTGLEYRGAALVAQYAFEGIYEGPQEGD